MIIGLIVCIFVLILVCVGVATDFLPMWYEFLSVMIDGLFNFVGGLPPIFIIVAWVMFYTTIIAIVFHIARDFM